MQGRQTVETINPQTGRHDDPVRHYIGLHREASAERGPLAHYRAMAAEAATADDHETGAPWPTRPDGTVTGWGDREPTLATGGTFRVKRDPFAAIGFVG